MSKAERTDPILDCPLPPFSVYKEKLIGPFPPEFEKLKTEFLQALDAGAQLIFIDVRGAENHHPAAATTKKIPADQLAQLAWFWRFLRHCLLKLPEARGFSVVAEGPDEERAMHRGADGAYDDMVNDFSVFRRGVINAEEGEHIKDRKIVDKKVVIVSRDSAPLLHRGDERQFLSKLDRLPKHGVNWEWLELERLQGIENLYETQVRHVLAADTDNFRMLFESALANPRPIKGEQVQDASARLQQPLGQGEVFFMQPDQAECYRRFLQILQAQMTDMVLKCLVYGDYDTGKTVMLTGAGQVCGQRGVEFSYVELKEGAGGLLNDHTLHGLRLVDQAERVTRYSRCYEDISYMMMSNAAPTTENSEEIPHTLKGHVVLQPGMSLEDLKIKYPQTLKQLHALSFAIPWQGTPRTRRKKDIKLS